MQVLTGSYDNGHHIAVHGNSGSGRLGLCLTGFRHLWGRLSQTLLYFGSSIGKNSCQVDVIQSSNSPVFCPGQPAPASTCPPPVSQRWFLPYPPCLGQILPRVLLIADSFPSGLYWEWSWKPLLPGLTCCCLVNSTRLSFHRQRTVPCRSVARAGLAIFFGHIWNKPRLFPAPLGFLLERTS